MGDIACYVWLTPTLDPLNLPNWRKWAAITALCFCKSSSPLRDAISHIPYR